MEEKQINKDYTETVTKLRDVYRAYVVTGNEKAGQFLADAAGAIELLRDKYYKAETDAMNLTGKLTELQAKIGDKLVEVVRCKDCKYSQTCGFIDQRQYGERALWYCADGDRKA